MANNIFQNNTKAVPTSDAMIVRVDMEQMDIGGRKAHLPPGAKGEGMAIVHIPNSKA